MEVYLPLHRSTVIDYDMIVGDRAPPRKTKIAVTIGPASRSPAMVEKLVDAGMDMARFKFSHATPSSNAETITTLRKVCMKLAQCTCATYMFKCKKTVCTGNCCLLLILGAPANV